MLLVLCVNVEFTMQAVQYRIHTLFISPFLLFKLVAVITKVITNGSADLLETVVIVCRGMLKDVSSQRWTIHSRALPKRNWITTSSSVTMCLHI